MKGNDMPVRQQGATQPAERAAKVAQLYQHRTENAQKRFKERVEKAGLAWPVDAENAKLPAWAFWNDWAQYVVDTSQRSVLFLDTLRQRGNNYHEHEKAGRPPLLHFACEMVLDARGFSRPVNYALVRITPPKGVTVDP